MCIRDRLRWTVEAPAKEAVFLDLTIKLERDGSITTATYVKPINPHLYILPNSAHPKGVLKSLIYGNVKRYWRQNSHLSTFTAITRDFRGHLLNRGHTKEVLDPLFMEAAETVDATAQKNGDTSCAGPAGSATKALVSGCRLFLHWEIAQETLAPELCARSLIGPWHAWSKDRL